MYVVHIGGRSVFVCAKGHVWGVMCVYKDMCGV